MQICPNCGKQIKYIAVGPNKAMTCENEVTLVYTESGRKIVGHKLHNCEVQNERAAERSNNR